MLRFVDKPAVEGDAVVLRITKHASSPRQREELRRLLSPFRARIAIADLPVKLPLNRPAHALDRYIAMYEKAGWRVVGVEIVAPAPIIRGILRDSAYCGNQAGSPRIPLLHAKIANGGEDFSHYEQWDGMEVSPYRWGNRIQNTQTTLRHILRTPFDLDVAGGTTEDDENGGERQ